MGSAEKPHSEMSGAALGFEAWVSITRVPPCYTSPFCKTQWRRSLLLFMEEGLEFLTPWGKLWLGVIKSHQCSQGDDNFQPSSINNILLLYHLLLTTAIFSLHVGQC